MEIFALLVQKIIQDYPLEQGYSDRDKTQTTGLPAAGEDRYSCFIRRKCAFLKKRGWSAYCVYFKRSRQGVPHNLCSDIVQQLLNRWPFWPVAVDNLVFVRLFEILPLSVVRFAR